MEGSVMSLVTVFNSSLETSYTSQTIKPSRESLKSLSMLNTSTLVFSFRYLFTREGSRYCRLLIRISRRASCSGVVISRSYTSGATRPYSGVNGMRGCTISGYLSVLWFSIMFLYISDWYNLGTQEEMLTGPIK